MFKRAGFKLNKSTNGMKSAVRTRNNGLWCIFWCTITLTENVTEREDEKRRGQLKRLLRNRLHKTINSSISWKFIMWIGMIL